MSSKGLSARQKVRRFGFVRHGGCMLCIVSWPLRDRLKCFCEFYDIDGIRSAVCLFVEVLAFYRQLDSNFDR
jgi:hypothetical protein